MEKKSQLKPFFIIGNPRSGTTLLRLMLTCHKDFVVPPECGFAVWYQEKYRYFFETDISTQINESLLSNFIDDLFKAHKFENWHLNRDELSKALNLAQPQNYSELVSAVYRLYAIKLKNTDVIWGDKNNFYLNHIPQISEMFPQARFIHIVRDGRAVMNSYRNIGKRNITSKYAPKLPQNPSEIAKSWVNNIEIIVKSFETLPESQKLEIRFEDLVLNPQKTLSLICEFLSTTFDPIMLEYHKMGKTIGLEENEFMQWKEKNTKPIMPLEAYRYKDELSKDKLTEFEKIAGSFLAKYNYL